MAENSRIIVEVPSTYKAKIMKKAKTNGTSMSFIIRDILAAWCKSERSAAIPSGKARKSHG